MTKAAIKSLFAALLCAGVVAAAWAGPRAAGQPPHVAAASPVAALLAEARKCVVSEPVQADALYREALRHAPRAWDVRKEFARFCLKHSRRAEAVEAFEACVAARGARADWTDLVGALQQVDDLSGAARAARRCAERFPDDCALQELAGRCLVAAGARREALPYLRTALHASPQSVPLLVMLGRAAEGNDDPVEAVSAYVRALQKMPDTVAARQGLERLRQRCHSLPGFLLALPAGWRSEGHMVTDDARRHGVVVHTTAGGAVRSLAETLALRSIPMELFDEQELLHGDGEEPNDGERAAETGDGETHAHRWPRHRLRREAISKPLQGQLLQIDVFPGRTSDGEQLTGTVRRSVFAAAIGGKTVGLVLEGDADLSQARTLLLTLAARLIPTVEQDGKRR